MMNYRRAAENIEVIMHLDQLQYPNLHKILNRRRGGLIKELLYVLDKSQKMNYLQFETYGAASFFQSIGHFIDKDEGQCINRAKQTWHYKLILLALIGLLKRNKPDDDAEGDFRKVSVRAKNMMQKATGRKAQPISYWYFDKFTDRQLKYCERRAKQWLDSKATLSNFTKETAIAVFGQHRADVVYQDKRTPRAITNMAYISICEAVANIIALKGYAYRDEALILAGRNLFDKMKKAPEIEKKQRALEYAMNKVVVEWGKQRHRILNAGGNQYSRPGKADRLNFGIKGNEWIITPLKNDEPGYKQVTK